MKNLKYFLQFFCILFLFGVFKIVGIKFSRIISENIMVVLGPIFRSKKIIIKNLSIAFPNFNENEKKQILKGMWINYGRIFAEYMFIKNFRQGSIWERNINIENQYILENVKKDTKPVIFISGHFNNFELMAMQIEKLGIDLAAVYRPLNNKFLNPLMESIRKKYICKKQIKKGRVGLRDSLKLFNEGYSVALMIDQRVSEGSKIKFFNKEAYTTTIPGQFVKKFNCKVIPIDIVRINDIDFKIQIFEPFEFKENVSIDEITLELNKWLEKIIKKNPSKWIWSHDRWK